MARRCVGRVPPVMRTRACARRAMSTTPPEADKSTDAFQQAVGHLGTIVAAAGLANTLGGGQRRFVYGATCFVLGNIVGYHYHADVKPIVESLNKAVGGGK